MVRLVPGPTPSYDIAQICKSGHVITAYARSAPERKVNFCQECSAPTITNCEACNEGIRGFYINPRAGLVVHSPYIRPNFCHQCGGAYPWTADALEAAAEFVRESESLSSEEKDQLIGTFGDVTNETPRTQTAGARFKRLAAKLGTESAGMLRDIIVNVASEAAKRSAGL